MTLSSVPPVRIVCTRDALTTAQNIQRLLAAEEHTVELAFSRTSMDQIEPARESGEAVLIVWSARAPTTRYVRKWAEEIEPARLVEISVGAIVPPVDGRVAPVIDFSSWNGTRGGPAWRALEDRLRQATRASEPPRPPPKRAAMVLGLVSIVAVGGAITERVLDAQRAPFEDRYVETNFSLTDGDDHPIAAGGAITALEPASAGDLDAELSIRLSRAGPRVPMLEPINAAPLPEAEAAEPVHFSQLGFMDRLASLAAPLVREEDE